VGPIDLKQGKIFWREFFYLWGAAAGVSALSLSLAHFPQTGLARQLFVPLHSQSTVLMLIALTAQNSIHLAVFVGVGLVAGHQVGLGAPVLEAWLRGKPIGPYLRAPVIPILLTILLFAACSTLANSTVFHPHRKLAVTTANEILDSSARAKVMEQIDKLGLADTKPLTTASLIISDLASAIKGELNAQLFEVSVIVLMFVQIFGKPKTIADGTYYWVAVLMVTFSHTALYLLAQHENTLMFWGVLSDFGLQHTIEPYLLIVARTSIRIIPAGSALGLLYVRHGIEAAMVASFASAVMAHLFLNFWFAHFA
jgi:hypothetical protein